MERVREREGDVETNSVRPILVLLLKLGLIEALVIEYRTVLNVLLEPECTSWSTFVMILSNFSDLFLDLGSFDAFRGRVDVRSLCVLSSDSSGFTESFLLNISDGSVRSVVLFNQLRLVEFGHRGKARSGESACLESRFHQRASGLS